MSCFHDHEDPTGAAGTIVDQLPAVHRPHLTLLMGDQVYLALPLLTRMRDDVRWLAAKFERDYTANWRGPHGYARILDAAPTAAVPTTTSTGTTHRTPATLIPLARGEGGQERWREAARAMYDAFQVGEADELEEPDRYHRSSTCRRCRSSSWTTGRSVNATCSRRSDRAASTVSGPGPTTSWRIGECRLSSPVVVVPGTGRSHPGRLLRPAPR